MQTIKGGRYFTLQDLSLQLKTYPMQVWRWYKAKKLQGTLIGDLLRFHEDDVETFLEKTGRQFK